MRIHGAGYLGPVEVRQWERNFEGGWFGGVAVERDAERQLVLVRYSTLIAGETLQAWAPEACVRPVPPPAPAEFWVNVQDGSALELSRGGGFWLARLEGVQGCGEDPTGGSTVYTVREAYGSAVQVVGLHALRPAWCWRPPSDVCVQKVLAGSSVVHTPRRDWVLPVRFEDALKMDLECGPKGDGVAKWEAKEARRKGGRADPIDAARLPSQASSGRRVSDAAAEAAALTVGVGGLVDGSEVWLQLGAEVECIDVGDGPCAGSWTAGEVVELRDSWEPVRAYHAPPPAQVVVLSRVRCDAGPYTPGGLLLLTQHAPLATVRPRPPPPPAHFLRGARPGMPLQMRWHGAWWDVLLKEVQMRPCCDVPSLSKGGACGRSDAGDLTCLGAAGCASAADGASGPASHAPAGTTEPHATWSATARSCAVLVPRYVVASPTYPDVCGQVAASMLRPAWRWERNGWSTGAAGDAVGAGGVAMMDASVATDQGPPAEDAAPLSAASTSAQPDCCPPQPSLRDGRSGSSPAAVCHVAGLLRGMAPSEATGSRLRVWVASADTCSGPEPEGRSMDQDCGGMSGGGVGCAERGETATGGGRARSPREASAVVGMVLGCDAERGLAVRVCNASSGLMWVGLSAAWEWVPEDEASAAESSAVEARPAGRGRGAGRGGVAEDDEEADDRGTACLDFDRTDGAQASRGARAARPSPCGSASSPPRAATARAVADIYVAPPAGEDVKPKRVVHPPDTSGGEVLCPGRTVELWGREEGFFGSWYEAEVLDIRENKARADNPHARQARWPTLS